MIVRVTLEIALKKDFDYFVPAELRADLELGSRVQVPFGHRTVYGWITAFSEESDSLAPLKPIKRVVGKVSLITPQVIELARWIGTYYCCAIETALKSVLPVSVRKEDKGWKERLHVKRHAKLQQESSELTKRQAYVLEYIPLEGSVPLRDLVKKIGTTHQMLRRLEDLGHIEIQSQIEERDPYAAEEIVPSSSLALNEEQLISLEAIKAALERTATCNSVTPFLLHGVTGSGKTEVYLQAIEASLLRGRGAIVLVPEISLTPQTVERFKSRFMSGPTRTQVAVLHSHLSAGERHDEWHKIRQGRAKIVIGARSAIFAPVENLGLIVVDEEHEHSYKQEETPRYHARDVAVMRGKMGKAVVVLGSATPSLESAFNAERGKYRLLRLETRADAKQLPIVRVIDMRHAGRKEKGVPILSPQLREALLQRLERKEQSILFLNRRGYSASLQCPECGYVAECEACSVSLTYHLKEQKMMCHICGHEEWAPRQCPQPDCGSAAIRYAGVGTERVEERLRKDFPHANLVRMDSDVMKRKEDYRTVLGDFKRGKIDILLGTQMIAKGLHFPNVTLVGIIYADLGLHIPDFRAAERTFQLLTQVAGRSGRGEVEGEVYVQAFTPFHPAIQYARRHDYLGFYEQELEFREQTGYPPYRRVVLITLKGRSENRTSFAADHLRKELSAFDAFEPKLIIMGPAPAPLLKAQNLYRYQIMLRTQAVPRLSIALAELTRKIVLPEDVSLTVDVDPVNLS